MGCSVDYNDIKNKFRQHKCCVIIPTYNNASLIEAVIEDVNKYCDDIIVINDGSTDETLEKLKKYPFIRLKTYPNNKGKGHALKTGFEFALESGYNYAITIDSDGQHYAKDLPVFLNNIDDNPNAILIGSRNLKHKNMPGKSSFANKFSNFWFKLETGLNIPDTQSGFRLYPLQTIKNIKLFSGKYEFELEIIVKASWKNIEIIPVPIDVHYPDKEDRVTHFRPFKDFVRISLLNTILVPMALFYYRPRKIILEYKNKSIKQIFREKILSQKIPDHIVAFSIAFGVFMGIFPIWGYQLIVGFIIAHFLKLNKAIFYVAANISLPPMIPFILYLSYVTGSYVMGEGSWTVDTDLSIEGIKSNAIQYFIGSIVLSFIAGIAFGAVSFVLLKIYKRVKNK